MPLGQGFQIFNFWTFPAYTSAMFKDGGRQYLNTTPGVCAEPNQLDDLIPPAHTED